jgi:hypothetical protein
MSNRGISGRKIRLAAIFEPGKPVRPVWFELDRRKHTLQEPTYRWQDREGEATLLHFTASDGEALYEIVYNPVDQSWTLHEQQAV